MNEAKNNLKNLVVAQEAYYADHYRWATVLDSLEYTSSHEVTIAVGTHVAVAGWCAIYGGDAPPPMPGMRGALEPAGLYTADRDFSSTGFTTKE